MLVISRQGQPRITQCITGSSKHQLILPLEQEEPLKPSVVILHPLLRQKGCDRKGPPTGGGTGHARTIHLPDPFSLCPPSSLSENYELK